MFVHVFKDIEKIVFYVVTFYTMCVVWCLTHNLSSIYDVYIIIQHIPINSNRNKNTNTLQQWKQFKIQNWGYGEWLVSLAYLMCFSSVRVFYPYLCYLLLDLLVLLALKDY